VSVLDPRYGVPHIPGYLIYDLKTGLWLTYNEAAEDEDYLQSVTSQGLAFAAIETWNQGSLQNKAKMLDLKRQMQAVADFLKKPRLYVLIELTEGKYREIV